ncbi:hypothetical protein IPA_04220 [Ignicoccus pacificus DSM 13166]|uniref:DUF61 family protein n=1 Tax=Ignicoccus pacificus DSM 13166 TaxID=940294 RepID=A0A977KB52_9CREN|nr:hypothetical protein IPA_04220 [Ignicoccus pacificus DSM 13166]
MYEGDRGNAEGRLLKVVINDIALINQAIPKTQITLKKALEGDLIVELRDGSTHYMDPDEVQKFYEKLPNWMRWIVKVPIIISFNPESETFSVTGDEWQQEALRYVLGMDKDDKLKFQHLERLIMEYGSLVFVIFAVDVGEIIK